MNKLTSFHSDIKNILEQARGKAQSAVNSAMVEAYWLIDRRIVEEQQGKSRAKYGQRLLENLSKELSASFGKGFSYANLRNFRQFYLTYPVQEICYTVCSKLSWSHNRLIMRVDDPKARDYYLREGVEQQWSVRQLERNIKSLSYQRLLSSQSQPVTEINKIADNALLDFIKDPYVLEFLQLPELEQLKENKLEQAVINELQKFLLEMGKGFSFVARQMRISTETSHFYIDLVFYNYLLKYSVIKENQQLFASKYQRILPTEEELIAEIEREKRLIEGGKVMDTAISLKNSLKEFLKRYHFDLPDMITGKNK